MNTPPFMQRPRRPGAGRAAAAAVLAVAAVWSTAAAASAQEPPRAVEATADAGRAALFSYSSDGVAFSEAVPDLFAGSPKLVPGEAITEELWVRNGNAMALDVSVAALAPPAAGTEHAVRLSPSPVVTIGPGAAAPLQVHLRLPESAGNNSQGKAVAVHLRISAREAQPSGGGELGHTGATPGIWPMAAAALLGGAGALLGARLRNRTEYVGRTRGSAVHEG